MGAALLPGLRGSNPLGQKLADRAFLVSPEPNVQAAVGVDIVAVGIEDGGLAITEGLTAFLVTPGVFPVFLENFCRAFSFGKGGAGMRV